MELGLDHSGSLVCRYGDQIFWDLVPRAVHGRAGHPMSSHPNVQRMGTPALQSFPSARAAASLSRSTADPQAGTGLFSRLEGGRKRARCRDGEGNERRKPGGVGLAGAFGRPGAAFSSDAVQSWSTRATQAVGRARATHSTRRSACRSTCVYSAACPGRASKQPSRPPPKCSRCTRNSTSGAPVGEVRVAASLHPCRASLLRACRADCTAPLPSAAPALIQHLPHPAAVGSPTPRRSRSTNNGVTFPLFERPMSRVPIGIRCLPSCAK